MIRFTIRILCLAACILPCTLAFAQTEFSADVVNLDKEGKAEAPSKMYFGKNKLRIEGGNDHGGRGSGIVLVNMSTRVATL